jgi:hypothetical protein
MFRRKRLLIGVAIIAIIPVAAIAWWLGSPLFLNKTINEELPFAVTSNQAAGMPDAASVEKTGDAMMTDMSSDAMMDDGTSDAMPMDKPSDAMMMEDTKTDSSEPVRLKTGEFQDFDSFHQGSGQAIIYQGPDGSQLLRLENFSVTNGPDLHVILATHPNPASQEDVKADGYVDLGALKGNRGNQNYEIPAGVDISSISSVVIYCQPFHVIFSVAPLQQVG